jgi:hypothetical protein
MTAFDSPDSSRRTSGTLFLYNEAVGDSFCENILQAGRHKGDLLTGT